MPVKLSAAAETVEHSGGVVPLLPGMVMESGGAKADDVQASGSPSKHGATDAHQKQREFMKLYPSSTSIYTLWSSVDTDGDGFLSEAEVRTLCKRLNVRWQTKQLWHEAIQIAERNGKQLPIEWEDSCIDFPMFVQIYQAVMGVERRTVRSEVKGAFERLDFNRNGSISKADVEKLVKSEYKALRLLPPGFDIEKDWEAMRQISDAEKFALGHQNSMADIVTEVTKTGKLKTVASAPEADGALQTPRGGGVTWDSFESWWKSRLGLIEADTAVLPEWFTYQLRQVKSIAREPSKPLPSACESDMEEDGDEEQTERYIDQRNTRKGRELWDWLIPRLFLMTRMRQGWGNLHSVYVSAFSVDRDVRCRCVRPLLLSCVTACH